MPSPGLRVLPLPALVCMEKHWRLLISISLLLWLPTRVRAEEEKTLAMIKPDGLLGGYKDKIKSILLDSGFHILKEMTLQLDEDKASLFYSERSEKSYFPSLVKYMTSGPVYVMVLEKENAISDWRVLIGPTDARKARESHPGRLFQQGLQHSTGGKGWYYGGGQGLDWWIELMNWFKGNHPLD